MKIDNAFDKSRFQFTVAAAFCFLTAVAIFFAVARWEHAFPYRTIIPAALLATACFTAGRTNSPDLAWGWIAIGWLLASINVISSLIDSFSFLGGIPPAREMQSRFLRAYCTNVALPLFLTIPSVRLAVRASSRSSSRARKWIVACAVIAFADCALATVFLLVLFKLPIRL